MDELQAERLKEFVKSKVYKLDIEPRLIEILTGLEGMSDSTKDPIECFALRRVYNYFKDFKLWLDTPAESGL
jgi:hypothetical protein